MLQEILGVTTRATTKVKKRCILRKIFDELVLYRFEINVFGFLFLLFSQCVSSFSPKYLLIFTIYAKSPERFSPSGLSSISVLILYCQSFSTKEYFPPLSTAIKSSGVSIFTVVTIPPFAKRSIPCISDRNLKLGNS